MERVQLRGREGRSIQGQGSIDAVRIRHVWTGTWPSGVELVENVFLYCEVYGPSNCFELSFSKLVEAN